MPSDICPRPHCAARGRQNRSQAMTGRDFNTGRTLMPSRCRSVLATATSRMAFLTTLPASRMMPMYACMLNGVFVSSRAPRRQSRRADREHDDERIAQRFVLRRHHGTNQHDGEDEDELQLAERRTRRCLLSQITMAPDGLQKRICVVEMSHRSCEHRHVGICLRCFLQRAKNPALPSSAQNIALA